MLFNKNTTLYWITLYFKAFLSLLGIESWPNRVGLVPQRWRVRVSGLAGIAGGGSEFPVLSPPSIPRPRCPWARHRTPNCSPGTAALAAHFSGCVFMVCVCVRVCSLLTAVCVHLDGLNAEHKFQAWVTILGHASFPFLPLLCSYTLKYWVITINYMYLLYGYG